MEFFSDLARRQTQYFDNLGQLTRSLDQFYEWRDKLDELSEALVKEGFAQEENYRFRSDTGFVDLGVRYDIETNEKGILLAKIWTNQEHLGKGYGSKLLLNVLNVIDKQTIAPVYLKPEPFALDDDGNAVLRTQREGGLSKASLISWYQRYGFKESDTQQMVRSQNSY